MEQKETYGCYCKCVGIKDVKGKAQLALRWRPDEWSKPTIIYVKRGITKEQSDRWLFDCPEVSFADEIIGHYVCIRFDRLSWNNYPHKPFVWTIADAQLNEMISKAEDRSGKHIC